MKTYKLYILSFIFLFSVSCDDELDLAPISQLNSESFYQSQSDFEQAIIGVYSGLQGTIGDLYIFGDIRSDNTAPVESGSITDLLDFDNFSIAPDNPVTSRQWRGSYGNINRINLILDRIEDTTFEDVSVQNRIKGEALFARGLVYFDLVRMFGDVPVVLTEITAAEALEIPRTSATEVYALIVKDLTAAAGLLPASYGGDDVGRATSIAANAILGRVQLTNGNFSAAEAALRTVTSQEGSGNVGLLADYASVFDQSNEYSAEIIFASRFANDGINGNGFNFSFSFPQNPNNKASGTGLFESYDTADLRRDVTLDTEISPGEIVMFKYGAGENGRGESDWPVMRYADVLLMLAEIVNEQGYVADGEAFDLLNRTRVRAGLPALTATDAPDQASFRLAIEQERRAEFAGEGLRWFDLVRTNRYESLLASKGADATSNLFPIPLDEIQKINDPSILDQNPGY
ncbi:RagB/SusD family nutrient uptake outer membrane protein [Zobellia roscoffensis]|uniref:RagB/SusD family nutrient uptake outer membrane protein n=1 Tax=Zobellia roscoffensis TaxID=2779508 RepID=UPI00188D0785|nr:RagB/SusD family nutrient uptake outer membrane protein [Zobellia roscoffensis]